MRREGNTMIWKRPRKEKRPNKLSGNASMRHKGFVSVQFWLEPAEFKHIADAAATQGRKVAAFVRDVAVMAAMGYLGKDGDK